MSKAEICGIIRLSNEQTGERAIPDIKLPLGNKIFP